MKLIAMFQNAVKFTSTSNVSISVCNSRWKSKNLSTVSFLSRFSPKKNVHNAEDTPL